MLFRSYLAVAPALAVMLLPTGLAGQEPAKRPLAEAPYQTKLECSAIYGFLSGYFGEETDDGQDAAERGAAWISQALAEKPDDQMRVATDFEAVAKRVQSEIDVALSKSGEEAFYGLIERYAAVCEQFDG